jgi:hypothetical protein
MEPRIANEFLRTTNEMQRYTMFFIVVRALNVSSGFPLIIAQKLYMPRLSSG